MINDFRFTIENSTSMELTESDLNFVKVLNYFEDISNVFQVSENEEINLELLKSYLPSEVNGRPNLYGLYIREENENWKLKYIGQRKYDGILERLKQHLVKKHKLTGSKLKNVNKALNEGNQIGIKLFSIRPDAMRLYYEEKLISSLELEWNQQKHKIKNR